MKLNAKKSAFGLAEVIIALLIIGIIASLVMPPVIKNVQKIIFTIQLKKIYTATNQAFALAMVKDGATDIGNSNIIKSIKGRDTNRTGQDAFLEEVSKYFKTQKIYKYTEYKNAIKPKFLNGKGYSTANNSAFTMILADGSIIRLALRRTGETNCAKNRVKKLGGKLYENYGAVYIDVNGEKGPNVVGLDYHYFFLGQDGKLYPNNGIDETINYTCYDWKNSYNHWTNYQICRDRNSYGYGCAARIIEEGWKMNY